MKRQQLIKNKGGRPTKLTEKFLRVAEEVINDDINAIIFTDEELRDQINDRLEESERISTTRWEEWKAGNMKDSIVDKFRGLYKRALDKQKKALFTRLQSDDKAWQRFAWIIERKFDNWNLRMKNEVTGENGAPMAIKFVLQASENSKLIDKV